MKYGEAVKAYPQGEEQLGFYLNPGADGKDNIQVGNEVHQLAYREPADYDEHGPGGTYCAA